MSVPEDDHPGSLLCLDDGIALFIKAERMESERFGIVVMLRDDHYGNLLLSLRQGFREGLCGRVEAGVVSQSFILYLQQAKQSFRCLSMNIADAADIGSQPGNIRRV
jgi:hypothetical protein